MAAGVPVLVHLGEPPGYAVVAGGDDRWLQLVRDERLGVEVLPREEVEPALGRCWRSPAPTAQDPAPQVAVAAPHLVIEMAFLAQEVLHPFAIENRGTAPLRVRSAASSCSCTQAQPGDLVVEPGESAEFEVRLQVVELGTVHQHLWLATNDPRRPMLPLSLTAESGRGITVHPDHLRIAGTTEGSREVGVTLLGPPGFRVRFACGEPDEIDVRVGRRSEGEDRVEYVLVVFTMPGQPGPASCELVIRTNHPDFEELRLPVSILRSAP